MAGSSAARGGYRIASERTWAAARREYLAGDSAPAVCRRHRLARSTFRSRASREGWRRCDAPPAPRSRITGDGGDPPLNADTLRIIAWRNAARAIVDGDRVDAHHWVKLSRDLSEVSRERTEVFAETMTMALDEMGELKAEIVDLGGDPGEARPIYPDPATADPTMPAPILDLCARLAGLSDMRLRLRFSDLSDHSRTNSNIRSSETSVSTPTEASAA